MKQSILERAKNTLSSLDAVTQAFEQVIIDTISAITPWLAPIIPASMTYHNMIGRLGFSEPIAFIGALAVEFLGLSAINTSVEFWRYNEDKKYRQSLRIQATTKKAKRGKRKFQGAPLFFAILTGLFYISIVLIVNAILDIGTADVVHIIAKALLSLLSVVAGVIIALRASHSRRLIGTPKVRLESHGGTQSSPIKSYQDYTRLNESRNGDGPISAETLMSQYGIARATAFRWQHDYRESHPNHAKES